MENLIPKEKEEAIKKDTDALQAEAQGIVVSDDKSLQLASAFLVEVKRRLKRLGDLRTEIVRPLKEAVKNADNWFKMREEPFEQIETHVKAKIGAYMEDQRKKAEAEAQRIAEEQARKDREAREAREAAERAALEATNAKERKEAKELAKEAQALTIEVEKPMEMIEKPKASVRTDAGLVTTHTVWTWELEDITRVPVQFITTDGPKITAEIRTGVRDIPGIRIFEKTVVTARA